MGRWLNVLFVAVGLIIISVMIWAILVVGRINKCNPRRSHYYCPKRCSRRNRCCTGPPGLAGATGPAGIQGDLGATGATGPTATGPTGAANDDDTIIQAMIAARCPEGQEMCGKECVSFSNNANHCGACDRQCEDGYKCVDGDCVLNCQAGFGDCDGFCTDTLSSEQHCGQCGKECALGQLCIDGSCKDPCPAGMILCHGQCVAKPCLPICPTGQRFCELSGCTDVANDAQNCTDCNVVCAPPNAAGICRNNQCELGQCHTGFADCDGDPSNGCETNIFGNPRHCGACGRSCPITAPFCVNGDCSSFPAQSLTSN
jgi:hypothetical protein